MRDDQAIRLQELSEASTDDLINIIQSANECGFESPEQRGEKVWLYKAANECAKTLAHIERVLAVKNGLLPPISQTAETQEKWEQGVIKKAEQRVEELRKKFS